MGRFRLEPFHAGDDEELVPLLAECFPAGWRRDDTVLWRWKYLKRPNFQPDDVVLVRRGDVVVGCFHSAVLPLRIADGLTVSASYDSDYAVLPDARGNDVTGMVYEDTNPKLVRRGVALRGGFTSRELNQRHYGKKYGYVFVPTATRQFRKFIGLDLLRDRLAELGKRALAHRRLNQALARHPLAIGIVINGLPEAVLHCKAEGFTLVESPARAAPVSVEIPYPLLATLPEGTRAFLRRLGLAILTRDARVRGLSLALVQLLQFSVAALSVRRAS